MGFVTELTLTEKALALRLLHEGPVLVLPNAWDAGSAAVVAAAGAPAIATTSGGVSWALGAPDGEHLTREQMMQAVARIAAAVDVPVTADIEAGFGPDPGDVAATVAAVLAAGAVGINLEDSRAPGGPLFDVEAQARRIRAGRDAAGDAGVPELYINARTDVYLFQIGEPDGRFDEALARAEAYAEAGADCLFVPGLLDLAALAALAAAAPIPISVMLGAPGGPTVAQLAAAGVRRVSVGTAMALAAYTTARAATRQLLTEGRYAPEEILSYFEMNALLRR
jgi:2-methylisocitrate lyase-like PEP mutase family enzyme